MKITFVLPSYPKPIGGYRVVYEYSNEFIKLGHKVNIVHPLKLNMNLKRNILKKIYLLFYYFFLKIKKPNTNWINYNKKIKLFYINELKNELIPNADFIFATAWQTAKKIFKFDNNKGKKFYLVQDFWPFTGSKKEIIRTWNKKEFFLITVSLWLKKLCLINSKNKNIFYIPNGVNHKTFFIKKELLKKKNKNFTIVLMYSDGKYKNIDLAFKTLEKFKSKYPNVEIKIFGKKKPPKKKIINFNFLGQISDNELRRLYSSSHVLLSTSKLEGGAGPVGEAMACGCAVLTTETKGSKDFVKNGYNGVAINTLSEKVLYKYLLKLYFNEKWRNLLIKNGIKSIKKFKWQSSAKKMLNLLKNEKNSHNCL
jgi:glycosyltransferase involved in cell wall biosynthesis